MRTPSILCSRILTPTPCQPALPWLQTSLEVVLSNTCLHELLRVGSSGLFLDTKKTEVSEANTEPEPVKPEGVVVNGKEEEPSVEEALSKGLGQMTTNADTDGDSYKDKTESVTSGPLSPEGSPSKSPSKKKKKFRTPSFLKKSKKKEKVES